MALKNSSRRLAREVALQALYAWRLAGGDALAHAKTLDGWQRCDRSLAQELVREVIGNVEALEGKIAPFLDRSLASLSPVERVILLVGAYELVSRPGTPFATGSPNSSATSMMPRADSLQTSSKW